MAREAATHFVNQVCAVMFAAFKQNFKKNLIKKLQWMSSDIGIFILSNRLCDHCHTITLFRDHCLSPYSLNSYLPLEQIEYKHLNTCTYVATERLWKHDPKCQIAMSQSQSRLFTRLKSFLLLLSLFKLLFPSKHQNTFSLFLLSLSLRYNSYMKEQGNYYKGNDAGQDSVGCPESHWKVKTLKWRSYHWK